MADLLALPGRSAVSSFRLAKLLDSLRAARPETSIVRSRRATATTSISRGRRPRPSARCPDRLLTYGPRDERPVEGEPAFVVVPAARHDLAWSSKATDIANCGLDAVLRVERGVDWHATTRDARRCRAPTATRSRRSCTTG
jgi:hypothetical protein